MKKNSKTNQDQGYVYDACVIGAGASGLVCGAVLARRGMNTLIIEQNKKSGRKLYATGNGKCNLANAVISDSAYYANGFAGSVVTEGSALLLHRYLEQAGIPLTEKNGYYYPQSLQASSVVWALTDGAKLAGCEFQYETEVYGIERTPEGGFLLKTRTTGKDAGEEGTVLCNRLVLAMGSPAAPHLGSGKEEVISTLLEDLGLGYQPFEPALCPLEVEEDVSSLAGVRVRARISIGLAMDRPGFGEDLMEEGEVMLTEYGLSGIVIFNMSTMIQKGEQVSVDLLPLWEDEGKWLEFVHAQEKKRTLFGILNGMLHEKLCRYFIEKRFEEKAAKRPVSTFSDEELLDLFRNLKDWRLTVTGKKADMGQACRGGVLTQLLSPDTLQVKQDPRIAVTGELTQVTGRCGGYNLMYALISGIRAGQRL